ncbi:alpha/beta hydrolase [Candidatus Sumerlaeota bacterium]|nr:alpha/beta hydrolase [Candidatus Sumerlaeota bacterium]
MNSPFQMGDGIDLEGKPLPCPLAWHVRGVRKESPTTRLSASASRNFASSSRPYGIFTASQMNTYVYKTAAGLPIRLDIHGGNPGRAAKPVLVFIHGGALIMGHRGQIADEQLQLYLSAGYAVASIDYRLAPETKLAEIIQDLKDAFAWIRAEGRAKEGLDAERIGVVGHSAGGYLTLMSGFCVQPRPRALVSFYGYGDIVGDWYSRPDPFYSQRDRITEDDARRAVGSAPIAEDSAKNDRFKFYLYCRQNGLWPKEVSGHDPAKEPDYFVPFCPLRNVTRDYPPTMLLHGDSDTDVPYEQSALMDRALDRAGVEHEFIPVSHGGHGFDHADGGLDNPAMKEIFEQVTKFLSRHV